MDWRWVGVKEWVGDGRVSGSGCGGRVRRSGCEERWWCERCSVQNGSVRVGYMNVLLPPPETGSTSPDYQEHLFGVLPLTQGYLSKFRITCPNTKVKIGMSRKEYQYFDVQVRDVICKTCFLCWTAYTRLYLFIKQQSHLGHPVWTIKIILGDNHTHDEDPENGCMAVCVLAPNGSDTSV